MIGHKGEKRKGERERGKEHEREREREKRESIPCVDKGQSNDN
jgi:hypothetical protein